MKKLLFALLPAVCFLSCDGTAEPPEGQTQWKYIYYTVERQDWELVGVSGAPNSFYEYSFRAPEITDFIYKEGVVMGYVVDNPGAANEVLRPLPDTWPVGDGPHAWTESVTFNYMPGHVTFYVAYSDFATNVRPAGMTFKLMMIW
jgi:hypothetical protein